MGAFALIRHVKLYTSRPKKALKSLASACLSIAPSLTSPASPSSLLLHKHTKALAQKHPRAFTRAVPLYLRGSSPRLSNTCFLTSQAIALSASFRKAFCDLPEDSPMLKLPPLTYRLTCLLQALPPLSSSKTKAARTCPFWPRQVSHEGRYTDTTSDLCAHSLPGDARGVPVETRRSRPTTGN